jgi:hypothetical protein
MYSLNEVDENGPGQMQDSVAKVQFRQIGSFSKSDLAIGKPPSDGRK